MCAIICIIHELLVPQKNQFLLFCKFDLPRKKLENDNFMGAAVLCANISQIFFLYWIIKHISTRFHSFWGCFFLISQNLFWMMKMAQNVRIYPPKSDHLTPKLTSFYSHFSSEINRTFFK